MKPDASAARPILKTATLAILVLGVACHATETYEMESQVTHAPDAAISSVAAAVRQASGWPDDTFQIRPLVDLSAGGCRLFAVGRTPPVPGAEPDTYGVLSDGSVAGSRSADGLSRVLRDCGHGQPALWWAQVVTLFAVSGSARVIDGTNPLQVGLVTAAGETFSPPSLESVPGKPTTLRFFAVVRATQPVRVELRMDAGSAGVADVEITRLSKRRSSD